MPKIQTYLNGSTSTSIRFKAGSYLYVEFSRDISPRFNRLGVIRCYHENYSTYCKYENERRIAFLARYDLDHNQAYGHNFSIIGVQRPYYFQNTQMYFALVPTGYEFKELEYQNSYQIQDQSSIDYLVNILPVLYYSQDSNALRSSYSFTMHIQMPANSIVENSPIWVDMPEEFDEAMFLGWTPSCQLKHLNDQLSNFVKSCALESIRRVKLNILTDPSNTEQKIYSLTIGQIPVYHYQQMTVNAPLVWFGNSTYPTIPLFKTNQGYFEVNMKKNIFNYADLSKGILQWENKVIECTVGVYNCYAKLIN